MPFAQLDNATSKESLLYLPVTCGNDSFSQKTDSSSVTHLLNGHRFLQSFGLLVGRLRTKQS